MAEETQAKAEEVAVEKAAVSEPPPPAVAEESEKPAVEAESEEKKPEKPAVETETEEKKPAAEEAEAEAEGEGEGEVDVSSAIPQSESFKEESNVVSDLQDPEKKALDELKELVSAALANNEFVPPPPPPPPPAKEEPKPEEAKTVAAPAAEEAKTEEPVAAPAAEEAKTEEPVAAPAAEETKPEEPVFAPAAEEPPKPAAEEAKPEEPVVTPAVEEVKTIPEPEPEAPVAPTTVEEVVAVEEKAVAVDDDGAKTVEAIEETIISVAAQEVAPGEPPAEPAAETAAEETPAPQPPAEEFLWGVPLLSDEKSDTILLKFLRARDFKVKDALSMIKSTVIWRKTFGIDALLDEDLGLPEMNKVVFMHGVDKEGHPVCYNVYGEFQDKDLYAKAFGDEEKRQKFLRWRIQFLEKGIRQQLDFSPGGLCTMVQVNDLKNSPGPGKRELRQTTNQALALLQDNYPEFVAKQIFINVPWWYLAYNRVISPFLTQRTKSKFVFAGPSKSAETLFKYIAPEQVPVQYGGLNNDNDPDFTVADAVTNITIKPSSKETIEIPVTEAPILVWELRVLGWDVTYGAEFVPSAENGYTVIVQKARKLIATDEPVVKNSFKIGEPGKIILTIDNSTSKKKKLLYRSKAKTPAESI